MPSRPPLAPGAKPRQLSPPRLHLGSPLAVLVALVFALTLAGIVEADPPQGGPAKDPRLAKDIKRGSFEGRQSLPSFIRPRPLCPPPSDWIPTDS